MEYKMANNIENIAEVEEADFENEFDRDDFGFIISADGELKSVMYPEHLMDDPPEEIKMILEIFGIDNFETIENRVLH
jgi:hypothetical protein